METITPDNGLLVWILLGFAGMVFFVIALLRIMRTNFRDSNTRLLWLILVLVAPILGPILFFTYAKRSGSIIS